MEVDGWGYSVTMSARESAPEIGDDPQTISNAKRHCELANGEEIYALPRVMKPQAKEEEVICLEKVVELFEHLEQIGYIGKVEFTVQSKPVRVHLHQPLKREELESFLSRGRPATCAPTDAADDM
jgi:hypothetical protein